MIRRQAAVGAMLLLLLAGLLAQTPNGKKSHILRGKVESVDADARTLTVNHERVEGWMEAMTMTYSVDKPDVLKTIKAGDRIEATVYDGDYNTLHDVRTATKPERKQP